MNKLSMRNRCLPVALLGACASHAAAQQYAVPWYTTDCGGGSSSGGSFALSGTIGQHDAGPAMSGGTLSLVGGFWAAEIARPCIADFNADGSVNTLDVLAFLNAWSGGDPSSDCNSDGAINTLDVLCFLNAWSAGC